MTADENIGSPDRAACCYECINQVYVRARVRCTNRLKQSYTFVFDVSL